MKIVRMSPMHFYQIWHKLVPASREKTPVPDPHFIIRHLDLMIVRADCTQFVDFPGDLDLNGSPISLAMLHGISIGDGKETT